MIKNIITLAIGILLLNLSCKKKEKTILAKKLTEIEVVDEFAKVPDSWITKRVTKAKARLNESEAGKIVWKAMEAHGGLGQWYKNGPVSFRFNYRPLDGGTVRDTYQAIDTWRSKARHYQANDSTQQYGWDGTNAWQIAKDSTTFAYNTRFWSLTPYFFAAQPFVLDGKGVNLQVLPQKMHQRKLQDVIKVTFDPETGDAPDDYYILYFDNQSHVLSVIRYIVSYPGYFKNGGHLPEKIMELSGKQEVNGIIFPKDYKTHWLDKDELAGEHITDITLSTIEFLPKISAQYFEAPEGALILEGL